MLCDICHKNQATLHLTEVVEGKTVETHLCQACAQAKAEELNKQLDIADFLGGLAEGMVKDEQENLVCPNCGLTYKNFQKKGRLGCQDCYVNFRSKLMPLFKRVHGSAKHNGKIMFNTDKNALLQGRIKELQDSLKRAVELEEYEEAAQLRDQIEEFKKQANQKKS